MFEMSKNINFRLDFKNPDFQITNYKQIPIYQIQNPKLVAKRTMKMFWSLVIVFLDLFVI